MVKSLKCLSLKMICWLATVEGGKNGLYGDSVAKCAIYCNIGEAVVKLKCDLGIFI